MNEILQKRIEEAAKIYAESEVNRRDDSTYSMHEKKRLKMFDGYDIEESLTSFSEQILQNQWISVEEAFPEYKEPIIVKKGTEYAFASFQNGNFYIVGNIGKIDDVTHWMPIPSLEGGEK